MAPLSNKRYDSMTIELSEFLDNYPDKEYVLETILKIVCKHVKYDPHAKQYDERRAEINKRYKEKKTREKLESTHKNETEKSI